MALTQAAQMAKGQGRLPAGVARLVTEMLNPRVPWQELLRRFFAESSREDYSCARANPRYIHTGFMLPALHSERLGKIAVAVDTSGSIDQQLLTEFMAEVQAILDSGKPSKLVLFDCDAAVNSVREYEPGQAIDMAFTGGGGTDFRPVFTMLDADPEPPICLIYLTDLWGTFPAEAPGYPVLWAATETRKTAPWGITVPLRP
jgi:predicted metal-dependent peptidase